LEIGSCPLIGSLTDSYLFAGRVAVAVVYVMKILLVSVILMMCLAYPSNSGGAGVSAGVSGNTAVGVASGPQGAQAGASGSGNVEAESGDSQSDTTGEQNAYSGTGAQAGQEERSESEQAQVREMEQAEVRTRNGTGNGSTVRTQAEIMATTRNMKEIQENFVARVRNISQNVSSADRAGQVSQIRQETNVAIKNYIETGENDDISDIEEAVEGEITISPASVSTDAFTANAAQKKLKVQVRSQEMVIAQEQNAVSFGTETGVRATAKQMTVANNTLSVDGQELEVLPSEAAQKLKGEVREMEMVQVNGRLAYSAQVKVRAKILGLIGTEYDVESTVDAQSGQVLSEKKPWWSFLAFN